MSRSRRFQAARVTRGPARATVPPSTGMPTSDLPGFTHSYAEDFDTAFPIGAFTVDVGGATDGMISPSAPSYARYGSKIKFYPDGSDDTYQSTKAYVSRTVSTKTGVTGANGVLDVYLHTEDVNGVPTPVSSWQRPLLPSGLPEQLYGRFAARMRADSALGYGAVMLLITDPWPDNGEQDWPEGDLSKPIHGFYHWANPAGGQDAVTPQGGITWQDWHTYVMEWTPGRVKWWVDDQKVLDTQSQVGSKASKFVIQTGGSTATPPAPEVSGSLQIDWISIWTYNG